MRETPAALIVAPSSRRVLPIAMRRQRTLTLTVRLKTMSDTPDLNIDRVAELARIALTPAEKTEFAAQLGEVLKHVEQLKQLDVAGVEPTAHAFAVENVWADDEAQAGLSAEDALRNAPAQRDNMIAVPKVVE
jgi:aspartyl-tRNA(Asn)/glutamyl-tRNA(Gln) amidotransferase subunit C